MMRLSMPIALSLPLVGPSFLACPVSGGQRLGDCRGWGAWWWKRPVLCVSGSACESPRRSSERRTITLDDYEMFLSALKQVRAQLVTIKHELEDALRNCDPLTGAGNHIAMFTKLRERQALAPRSTCLVMMDLDHFKEVNDTYGHMLGDEFLVQYAEFVMSHLRPYDELFSIWRREIPLLRRGCGAGAGPSNCGADARRLVEEGILRRRLCATDSEGFLRPYAPRPVRPGRAVDRARRSSVARRQSRRSRSDCNLASGKPRQIHKQ